MEVLEEADSQTTCEGLQGVGRVGTVDFVMT